MIGKVGRIAPIIPTRPVITGYARRARSLAQWAQFQQRLWGRRTGSEDAFPQILERERRTSAILGEQPWN